MWTVYSKLFIFCVVGAAAVIFFIYISLQDITTSGGDKTSVSGETSVSDQTSYSDFTKVENPKKLKVPDYSNEFTVVFDDTPLKYILQWTKPNTQPFVFMGVERDGFIRRKCKFTNCVVTSDRNLLGDVAKFDVVLFHGPELVYVPIKEVTFPKRRSLRQKYVFASMESGHYYPICSEKLNGYFNWTWTFKLDSDARWGYLLVKDSNDTVIGPSKIMHWMKLKDMDPVSEEFKKKLKSKSKAAAWFVSNCGSRSGRQEFAKKLEKELRKYGHTLDVFGQCGTKKCGREANPDNPDCDKMVSDKYFFYLAFENSFSEDYVTEKLLRSLKNNAVPIVFGGANYTSEVINCSKEYKNDELQRRGSKVVDPPTRENLKYMLQWTRPDMKPFVALGVGQKGFIVRNCTYTNCVVTSDRYLLGDVAKFDVILFHGPEVRKLSYRNFPKRRSPKQKYVFASKESAHYYPICSHQLDGYFNWTWTFRLNSDAIWGYILVKDSNGEVVGPKRYMQWMKFKDMNPVSDEYKNKLKSKSKAAAWFVSNCNDISGRTRFADQLKIELKKYNLVLNVYGKCGTMTCISGLPACDKMISETYYFYLSFENSLSEDYVTEKLLRPLKNDAVPIVFGGANYRRFMPDGIYLNARALGPELLAKKMDELIKNPEEYANYFRWRNHYSYHSREETPEHNDYCNFCAILNDDKKMKEVTVIQNLKDWWDFPQKC